MDRLNCYRERRYILKSRTNQLSRSGSGPLFLFGLLFVAWFLSGCSPTRKLNEGQRFLASSELHIHEKGIPELDDVADGLILRSNTKFLGLRIPLMFHQIIHPQALERALTRREEKGHEPGGLRWFFSERIGEPPVLFDPLLVERSQRNLLVICQRKGFLDAKVETLVDTVTESQASVIFELEPGTLWRIREVHWLDLNSGLPSIVPESFELYPKAGSAFNANAMDDFRMELSNHFKNQGFPTVREVHFAFRADTTIGNGEKLVDLTIEVLPEKWTEIGEPQAHALTRFGEINWRVDGDPYGQVRLDSCMVNFLITVEPQMRFNESVLLDTHSRLSGLPSVSRVEIPGVIRKDDRGQSYYDVNVILHLRKRFGITTSLDLTRTDARYGPIASWTWMDQNVSGRGDQWTAKISGGITSTRAFSYNDQALVPNSGTWTIETGYSRVGIFPVPLGITRPSNQARTGISASWIRENRPDYIREAFGFNYGFNFIENPQRNSRIAVDLIEGRLTQLNLMEDFQDWLNQQNNPFVSNRFQNYASFLSRMNWTTNWLVSPTLEGTMQADAEWTGWGMSQWAAWRNWDQNEWGQYTIGSIPFAHYLRCTGQFIWRYKPARALNWSFHGRLRGGWIRSGENFETIPFDRSFYAGGSNGIRGWQTRDLGPGLNQLENSTNNSLAGLGDLQLELSSELRKKLTDVLGMAMFMDVGNVWLNTPDSDELTRFSPHSLAWGSGIGARLDFEFFILRLDAAMRLFDPTQAEESRWFYQGSPQGALHLGIGHPF